MSRRVRMSPVCCSVLQRVAVCCSEFLQCACSILSCKLTSENVCSVLRCVAAFCSVLQGVAVCCCSVRVGYE